MKPETIKAIFTNLLFVIGVILFIVGFVQGTRTAVKLAIFDKYPLDTYIETKCDQPPYIAEPQALAGGKAAPVTESTIKETRVACQEELTHERKVKETEDIVGSITMLVSGGALIFFFRKYILK